jgi:hypothetical protein
MTNTDLQTIPLVESKATDVDADETRYGQYCDIVRTCALALARSFVADFYPPGPNAKSDHDLSVRIATAFLDLAKQDLQRSN